MGQVREGQITISGSMLEAEHLRSGCAMVEESRRQLSSGNVQISWLWFPINSRGRGGKKKKRGTGIKKKQFYLEFSGRDAVVCIYVILSFLKNTLIGKR